MEFFHRAFQCPFALQHSCSVGFQMVVGERYVLLTLVLRRVRYITGSTYVSRFQGRGKKKKKRKKN